MTSLLSEYRERHNIKCVFPLDEGLCFFEKDKKPIAIVMTSSHSRSNTTCRKCLFTKGLIAELFIHNGLAYPNVDKIIKLEKHEHINPDIDLMEWIGKKGYEPFVANSFQDVECWLWRFYIRDCGHFAKKWHNKEEPQRSIEQMIWSIDRTCSPLVHRFYEHFYKNIYSVFIPGRRYILF